MTLTAQPESTVRLRGRRLVLARVAWLAWAVLVAGLFVASLPINFEHRSMECTQAVCHSAQVTPEQAQAFQALGLSIDFLAKYSIAIDVVFAAIYFAIALVIFARRSDEGVALFVAFTLVTFGLVTVLANLDQLAASLPAWWLPVQFISFMGSISILFFFYLFPNGQFVPRWTRWLAILWIVVEAPNYFFPDSPFSRGTWPGWLDGLVFVGFIGSGLFAQVYRYRRVSGSAQRQQTKWVVFGATAAFGGFFGSILLFEIIPSLQRNPLFLLAGSTALPLFFLLIPLSIGLAILRSRLWDIDLIVRRTLMYAVLTAWLALVYFGIVILLQQVFRSVAGETPDLVIVASTLAIAALFLPLRRRVQNVIDRRFYRRKYDAQKVLEQFAATARDETDLEKLTTRLVEVVQDTMQPAHVSLWLREPESEVKR